MSRAISLRDVSKVYADGVAAVDRLSLDIEPDEFLVLLGPSGCGKSTVLRMIAGLEPITSGEVLLDGEYANEVPPADRNMAMVFQNFALYPHLSNRENIAFPLLFEAPGERDIEDRIMEVARTLGIHDLLDRRPAQLSGGERQRVAMGRAIARRPSAFLMDEPLSNLDAKLRSRLRVEISRLTRELGVTTVYVTHDQTEAMSLGDRVAIMRGGILQQVGSPRDAYHLPANVFVAAFVGTPRINLLQATVHTALDGGVSIEFGHQFLELPQPLTTDHQLLRIEQGRRVIVGLRSEAVRIAEPTLARPDERALQAVVEYVDYQGHECLVHVSTGAWPAVVPDLESPRPPVHTRGRGRTRVRSPTVLGNGLRRGLAARLTGRAASVTGSKPPTQVQPRPTESGDVVLRTTPDLLIRPGDRVPLLVDLGKLYVFDQTGNRICPAPRDSQVRLEN